MTVTINGTTGIAGVDGSAGTPAVQGADTNTGMFFPAADTIAFAEGGVEAMRIDSSGFVGIGTTTPSSYGGALVVRKANTGQGVTNATAQFSDAVNSALWIGHTSGATNLVADQALTFGYSNGTTTTENARITTSGNLQFNSGYGSVATAYGCRAWVNFNGNGTVAIRASGNVSSITDNGTGNYTVNFTTAMSDANYSFVASCGNDDNNGMMASPQSPTFATGSARFVTRYHDNGAADASMVLVAVFR